MNNQYQIRVHSGSLRGQAFLINKNEFKVGRDPSCDIVLSENAVSRVHLLIYPQAYNAIVLVDNNSTNGTTVNNVPVSAPTQIAENDVIMLGGEVALVLEKVPVVQSEQPSNQPYNFGQPVPGYRPPAGPAAPEYKPNAEGMPPVGYPQPPMGAYPGYANAPYQGAYPPPAAPQAPAAPAPANEPNPESSHEEHLPENLTSAPSQQPNYSGYPMNPSDMGQYPQDYAADQPSGYSGAPQSVYPPMSQPAQPGMPGQPPYGQQPYPGMAYPADPYSGQQGYYNPNPVSQYPNQAWSQQPSGYPQAAYNPNQPDYGQAQPPYGQPPYGYPPQNQGYYGNQPYYGNQQPGDYAAGYGTDQEQPQNNKKRLFIILGIVLFIILLLIGFIIYIDTNYLWCKVFPFLWSPEACAVYP